MRHTLLLMCLLLAGCGGGGGSGAGPLAPPPGPPVVMDQEYDADLNGPHTGVFANETATVVTYNPGTNTLVIDTVAFGSVTVGPGRTFVRQNTTYNVNFSQTQLVIVNQQSTSGVAWNLTLMSSNG